MTSDPFEIKKSNKIKTSNEINGKETLIEWTN